MDFEEELEKIDKKFEEELKNIKGSNSINELNKKYVKEYDEVKIKHKLIFNYSEIFFDVFIFDRDKDNLIIKETKKNINSKKSNKSYTLNEEGLTKIKTIIFDNKIYKLQEIKNVGIYGGKQGTFFFSNHSKRINIYANNIFSLKKTIGNYNAKYLMKVCDNINNILKDELNITIDLY